MIRAIDKWLWPYLTRERYARPDGVVHVLLCVCDHFEPFHAVDRDEALRRVDRWLTGFPALAERFRDATGRTPAHTFFYPVEQYDPDILEKLASLCEETHTEVEIHLHHDNDTPEGLRSTLDIATQRLAGHGLLCRDPAGAIRFGFIHGDWALSNCHPAGRHCGVDNELAVLCEAGCYADFTMPSAPHPTQPRTINSIYYPGAATGARALDTGAPMRVVQERTDGGAPPDDRMLIVQGPLCLNWQRRKFGVLPRLENGELSGANPPTLERLHLWMRAGVHVLGRPKWIAVKLHTHGGIPRNMDALLGEPAVRFYDALAQLACDDANLRVHFVTARELVNILLAARASVGDAPAACREVPLRRISKKKTREVVKRA